MAIKLKCLSFGSFYRFAYYLYYEDTLRYPQVGDSGYIGMAILVKGTLASLLQSRHPWLAGNSSKILRQVELTLFIVTDSGDE